MLAGIALAAAIAVPSVPSSIQSMSIEEVAGFTFLGTCIFGLLGGKSADEFARNADIAASTMPVGFPSEHVQLGSVNRNTCRVIYSGIKPDIVFSAFEIATDIPKGSCEIKSRKTDSVLFSCAPVYMRDGYDGFIQRSADGRVVGSITVTSPAIMLMPVDPKTSAIH